MVAGSNEAEVKSVLVVGVDPGESMGIAAILNGYLSYARQGTPQDGVTAIEVILDHSPLDKFDVTIACERFIQIGGHARTHQPRAQQLVGVVESVAARYGVPFTLQGPADARALADNAMLRRLGMFQTRKDVDQLDADDANMAVRHALLCLSRKHATIFDRLLT